MDTQVGPDVRPATTPTKAKATRKGSRHNVLQGVRSEDGSGPSLAHARKAQASAHHARRGTVGSKLLSGQETDRFGRGND